MALNETETNAPRYQALVLSGGGVRGLYTISILAELEEKLSGGATDYSIAKHFDFIGGTSIGGILALGLAAGKTAREMQTILDNNRKLIFPKRWFSRFRKLLGVEFSSEELRKVIQMALGDIKIKDLKYRVLIPTVNGSSGQSKVFKTPHHPNYTWDGELKVVDAALATSAAPTYFSAHTTAQGKMLDGGLFANSPSFLVYHEITCKRFLAVDPHQLFMLSIGTMASTNRIQRNANGDEGYYKGWGFGERLISLMMDVSEYWHTTITSHYLENRFVELDDRDIHKIELSDSSEKTAILLKTHAATKAQAVWGNSEVKAFFAHEAPKPTFYANK